MWHAPTDTRVDTLMLRLAAQEDKPAGGAALDQFTRPSQSEREILQRELKSDVPGWVWLAAASVVLVCTLILVVALGWGVARISRHIPHTAAPAAAPREQEATT